MLLPVNFPNLYVPIIGELQQAFEEFVVKGQYIGGDLVTNFEQEVSKKIKAQYVVGCKSGTNALQLALIAAGIKNGDEVITVANTYYATAWSIIAVGAIPVFCDTLAENGQIDCNKIIEKITPKTKAIMPVHLYGIPCDLDSLRKICFEDNLTLIEDAAHAFGSKYKNEFIGQHSDFACVSLYPTKNLGAFGDAGIVLTNSKEREEKVRQLTYFALDSKKEKFNPQALHTLLDPLQANLLRVVLRHIDHYNKQRQVLANVYYQRLNQYVRVIPEIVTENVVPYMFPFFIENKDELINYLLEKDIWIQVNYSVNLHWLPQFKSNLPVPNLPNSEKHNSEVVTLSIHPSFSVENATMVCDHIINFLKNR